VTPPSGQVVLLVEDHDATRDAFATFLGMKGHTVHGARNGREALALLRARLRPDVILLDLNMPGGSGWAFREHQLRDPALAPIPVVIVSALAAAAGQADLLGDVDYLQKPVDPDELLAAVERFAASPR
jgi:CheY-like chemotaxis protein